jgi:hypothetical protein
VLEEPVDMSYYLFMNLRTTVTFLVISLAAAVNHAGAGTVTFDFEKDKQGWKNVEGWLGNLRSPVSSVRPPARIPAAGKFILATKPWHSGVIESPVFAIEGSKATFLLGGAGKPSSYVTLHTLDGKEVRRTYVPLANAPDLNKAYKLEPCEWDLTSLVGKKGFLRISAEPFGYALVKRVHSNVQESFVVFDNFNAAGGIDAAATKQRDANRVAEKQESIASIKGELDDIVFAVRKRYREGHWYANIGHWSGNAERDLFHDGARLCRLNVPTGKVEVLFEDEKGGIRDPQVHYDGGKVIFSYRPGGSKYYNLYELDLDSPGTPRRITSAPFDDIEPTYTPGGKIVFCSTRCKRWVPCYYTEVATLYSCNLDGTGIRRLSANVEHENTPWPLPDGRLLYTRWEYVERSVMDFHHLWTTNPDGTRQEVFYGNMHPGYVMIDAKPVPGSGLIASIFSPGHGRVEHHGIVVIVDPGRGPDDKTSVRNIGWGRESRDVYPVGNKGFLTARNHTITLMDYEGREEVLYSLSEDERKQSYWCSEPRPVRRRKREQVVPNKVNLAKAKGTLMLDDVYNGRNMKGIKRGDIKKLLVLEYLPKSINISNGAEPCSRFTHNHERVLGTVPVEPDGSANFEVPALTAIVLAALDKNDIAVKRMQSFITVQPGEVSGCVGCHEERTQTPRTAVRRSMAMSKAPSKITPIKGIPDVFDFPRDIQPILDRHCVGCHDYDRTKQGGPRSGGCILTGDRGPMWSHSYISLTGKHVSMGSRMGNNAPYKTGSGASRLMKMIDGSHPSKQGVSPQQATVKLSAHEKTMIRLWIDSGAIYSGTLAGEGCGMIYEKLTTHAECYKWFTMGDQWPERLKAASTVVQKRCAGCHDGKKRAKVFDLDITRRPSRSDGIRRMSPEVRVNLTRPEKSLLLMSPLSKQAGGFDYCGKGRNPREPIFADKADPDYRQLLAYVAELKEALNRNKRFDMPGFKPNEHYVREMKRYGIIPQSFDRNAQTIDVYKADRAYWDSVRWKP